MLAARRKQNQNCDVPDALDVPAMAVLDIHNVLVHEMAASLWPLEPAMS